MDKRPQEIVHKGATKFQESTPLTEIFDREVANNLVAWYVDYYTENAEQYRVRYLAQDDNGNMVKMTNENKSHRDPADLESSQWGPDDVAEWFTEDGSDVQNRLIFLFAHAAGETFGIHAEAYRVFSFGPASLSLPTTNLWPQYVEDGIHGPILGCGDFDQFKLLSIIENPNVHGHLDDAGLLSEYMGALATVLDG
jgi:hypothetical protein